jgi:hypothetical protein
MADNNNNLNITIQLRDLASKKLAGLKKSIKGVQDAATGAAQQLTKYRKANIDSLERSIIANEKALVKKRDKEARDDLKAKQKTLKEQDRVARKSEKERLGFLDEEQQSRRRMALSQDMQLLADIANKKKEKAREIQDAEKKAYTQRKEREREERALARQQKADNREKERRSIQKADADFTQFNKTLFTTAAFIGTFTKLFQGFGNRLQEGAQLDRLQNQFSRVFGHVGIGAQISSFTTTAVDEVTAMQAALEMGNLGVAKNSDEAAKIIAMAATASKMSNLDVSYGIDQVTDALKTGSLANLEHLNLIKTGDPALKQRLSLLQKFTGIMSPAAVAQEKYNIILAALNNKTKEFMHSEVDLLDVLTKTKSSFKLLGGTLGSFLGRAVGDVVIKFTALLDKTTEFFERAKKNQPLVEMAKNLLIVGSTLSGVIATLGTMRLALKLAGAAGLGSFGGFLGIISAIALSLKPMTGTIEEIGSVIKGVGAIAGGVYQLVSSYFLGDGNLEKGIGKIDASLKSYLQGIKIGKTDAFIIATTISQAAIVTFKFIQDVIKEIVAGFKTIANSEFFKSKIFNFDLNEPGAWSKAWIDETNSLRDFMVKMAAGVASAWALSKIFPLGALGKLASGGLAKGAGAAALRFAPAGLAGAAGGYGMHKALGTGASAYNMTGAGLGTVAGGLFGGPVGAVAGGALGYMAGDSIESLINSLDTLSDIIKRKDPESARDQELSNFLTPTGATGFIEEQINAARENKNVVELQTKAVEDSIQQTALMQNDLMTMTNSLNILGSTLQGLKDSNMSLIDSITGLTNLNNTMQGTNIWNPQDASVVSPTGAVTSIPGVSQTGKGITHVPKPGIDITATKEQNTKTYEEMINLSRQYATAGQEKAMAQALAGVLKDGIIDYGEMQSVYEAALKPLVQNSKPPKTPPANKTGC